MFMLKYWIEQVKKYAKDIDIIQVGSRNMYNYELLKELGKYNKPVLLKRGFSATYKEWIMAAKYINNGKNVINVKRNRIIAIFLCNTKQKT